MNREVCEHFNPVDLPCDKCKAEPVEPVAYSVGRALHWHQGRGVTDAQLYIAPPKRPAEPATIAEWWADKQRKPLTDDQLDDIAVVARKGNLYDLRIAIERAHGIA